MTKPRALRSVSSLDKSVSPLRRLAMQFHQDFSVERIEPDAAGLRFIRSLTPNERLRLRQELQVFLAENAGRDQKGLRNAWKRKGAQWEGARVDLRGMIEGWLEQL